MQQPMAIRNMMMTSVLTGNWRMLHFGPPLSNFEEVCQLLLHCLVQHRPQRISRVLYRSRHRLLVQRQLLLKSHDQHRPQRISRLLYRPLYRPLHQRQHQLLHHLLLQSQYQQCPQRLSRLLYRPMCRLPVQFLSRH
jgi:hypothetical protein